MGTAVCTSRSLFDFGVKMQVSGERLDIKQDLFFSNKSSQKNAHSRRALFSNQTAPSCRTLHANFKAIKDSKSEIYSRARLTFR